MPMNPRVRHLEAIVMLLLANLLWGISFPTIKALTILHAQLLPEAGTWFSAIYTVAPRFVLATLILVVMQGRGFWRITKGEWQQGTAIGVFSAVGMLLQNDAIQFTEASTSAFLTQFYAILIPLVLAVRSRRSPGARVWLCCGLVLAGVAILGRFKWDSMSFDRGEAETLLASVFFMGQILCLGGARFAGNRPLKITLVMFAVQALIFSALAGVVAPSLETLMLPWTSLPWLGLTLILTVFCTVGAFTLMNTWQPKITTTEAGLIYCAEPIFGSAMALFMPVMFSVWAGINYANETATLSLIVGGALITGANVLMQLRPPGVTLPGGSAQS